ncbi:MAG: isoaspartyl peptidase/L-asparaginase [Planctomycetes bacterium]|nr:isoaspartyl peptidase/L-asparaginase [Planctomycetota bacterium]MCW8136586.1 isoaspartyl peptidase/L-asparaginase [Planctomycetota bacterium]
MKPIILTHGGAGRPTPDAPDSTGAREEAIKVCLAACEAGAGALRNGVADAALEAAIAAAIVLEDDPRFNAGTGANLRLDGSLELDASVATGDGRFAAVACLRATKNPVLVARELLRTPHVMLCGEGATRFARQRGFAEASMVTEKALKRWKAARERLATGNLRPYEQKWKEMQFHGTIGAVARARDGTFAVTCSTGGTSMMLPGRIGDTPIWGAGVFAGEHGAVCSTGHGELCIKRMAAWRVYQRIAKGEHPQAAAQAEVDDFPEPYEVGFIAVSKDAHGIAATGGYMPAAAVEAG